MSASCCCAAPPDPHRRNPAYKRVPWVVLVTNAVMFVVEIAAGLAAGFGIATSRRPRLLGRCR